MKRFLHAVFAFAVAVASCQCAVMAAPMDAMTATEACHESGDMQDAQIVHSGAEDCCEQPSTAPDYKQVKFPDLVAIAADAAPDVAQESDMRETVAFARHQRPPPNTTPVSRHDQILS